MMKVTICVPVYGVEKYIERCAVSLFEQTYNNLEYVFVDDCTPDKSIEILLDVLRRYPHRTSQVRIIRHEHNRGLGCVRNTAVENATGEFILHVDSDDYIKNDCVQQCVECQQKTGADIVSFSVVKLRYNRKQYIKIPNFSSAKELNVALIRHDVPNSIWGRLIRRSLYTDNGIKVEGVDMSEDLNVMPRLVYFAKKVAVVSETQYFYECSNINSYTASFSRKKLKQSLQTLDLLTDFFESKDIDFQDALNYRKAASYLGNLINCTKDKGNEDVYYELCGLIDKIPKLYFKPLSRGRRIALLLTKNYRIFSLYVGFATTVRNFLSVK